MSTNRPPILVRINPGRVIVDPKFVSPTNWDMRAVAEDLKEYVTFSRIIKGAPVVRLVDGALKVVSGEPFLTAAQEAVPPLEEIVCSVQADEQTVQALGLEMVSASELLDKFPEEETYDALEILTFVRLPTSAEQKSVEAKITNFFNEVSANPSTYGGRYSSISPFEWDQSHNRVRWTWVRNDQFGRHALLFSELLREINQNIVPLRSWNGLTPFIRSDMI
jgi:hypothetical protein